MTGTIVLLVVIFYFVGTLSTIYLADRPRKKKIAELNEAWKDYGQSRKEMFESLDKLKQTIAENKQSPH